ncbi:glycogen synthase [Treponema brennaborense]|uniref:starch synthase n=1 Tax=Treponema brennaborense (strain DSM 12168 / CIP 105900 / DD5/3) TaxID=906968 RepID=F4LMP5_TREBD|nr:glycogen/starch synthase [Treponema brennaborense]AEE16792.1 Starch synthase [Treponema brennaborense DSM 12168]
MTDQIYTVPRTLWLISREYAGIAEAGGVKNVACSLCEGLAAKGCAVTLLIPRYACSDFHAVTEYTPDCVAPQQVCVAEKEYTVSFDSGYCNGVKLVFVLHQIFADKTGVYTYTAEDERRDPRRKRGTGHADALLMDVLFQKAVLAYGTVCGLLPDVIHCQDAATALIPVMARNLAPFSDFFGRTRFAVTIHNAGPGYHHEFPSVAAAIEYTGLPEPLVSAAVNGAAVEPFLLAGAYAGLSTVSPWYADELLNPANADTGGLSVLFSRRHFRIKGITNGIDCDKYDPSDTAKSLLPFAFAPAHGELDGKYKNRKFFIETYAGKAAVSDAYPALVRSGYLQNEKKGERPVYFCYHGRIVSQKGIDILILAASALLASRTDARVVIVGQGEALLENALGDLAVKYAGRCVYFCGYDRAVSRLATAVSDFIVLPSKFEPCGLEDFIGQLFGTVPVAHATGGLNKISDGETGFLYTENTPEQLLSVLTRLTALVKNEPSALYSLIERGAVCVADRYAWEKVIEREYVPFYAGL